MEKAKRSTGRKINFNIFIKRILMCLLFIYLLSLLISQQFKFARLKEENMTVDAEIEAALSEQDNLNHELEIIDDEDYLRRIIREKLGFVKPNERVFVDSSK